LIFNINWFVQKEWILKNKPCKKRNRQKTVLQKNENSAILKSGVTIVVMPLLAF